MWRRSPDILLLLLLMSAALGTSARARLATSSSDDYEETATLHTPQPYQGPNANCKYGTQAGYWNITGEVGRKWMAITPACSMHNYIQAALRPSGSPLLPVRIYFISDSLDLRKLQDYQAEYAAAAELSEDTTIIHGHSLGSKYHKWPSKNHEDTSFDVVSGVKVSPYLNLAMRYMPGVHPEGPYNGDISPDLSWRNTVSPDLDLFERWFDAPPDLVVVGSNLWDLARIYAHEHDLWQQYEDQGVPEVLLKGYLANLTSMVSHVRSQVPESTLIFFRTHPFPHYDYNTGNCERTHLTNLQWISTLNSAGKAVAEAMGLEILDEGAMLTHFSPSFTIRDQHHPKPWCNFEVMNVMLNMLAQAKPELFVGWLLPQDMARPTPYQSLGDSSAVVSPADAR